MANTNNEIQTNFRYFIKLSFKASEAACKIWELKENITILNILSYHHYNIDQDVSNLFQSLGVFPISSNWCFFH